jgi:hypothetical protein
VSQSHTAQYQGEATIHYPFHPRRGERVEIVRCHRFRSVRMFVVRQPDGTLAQIPTWMCSPAAAAMAVRDQPRLSVEGLRDLRLALDAILLSLSGMDGGERDGTSAALATRRSSGADGIEAGVGGDGAGDGGSAASGAPAGGSRGGDRDSRGR